MKPRHHPNFPGKQHVLPRPSQPAPKPIPPPPSPRRYFAPCDEHDEVCTGHPVSEPTTARGPWKYLYDDYSAGTVFITRDPQDSQTPLVAGLTIEQAAPIVAALNAARPFNSSAPMTEPVPEGDIVTIEINQEQPEEKVETTETTETETETTETVTEKPADEDEDE